MFGYPLSSFYNNQPQLPVNITEYGAIGGFIAGSFSGTFYEDIGSQPDLTRPYDVTCSFRIKRQ